MYLIPGYITLKKSKDKYYLYHFKNQDVYEIKKGVFAILEDFQSRLFEKKSLINHFEIYNNGNNDSQQYVDFLETAGIIVSSETEIFSFLPKSLVLEVTSECNFKCKHCYRGNARSNKGELELENIERIAKECINLGIQDVTLTGGEPFSRNDFVEILDLFLAKNIYITVKTNLSYIIPSSILELLKNTDNLKLEFTVYGLSWNIFKKFCHNKNTYAVFSDNLQYFLQENRNVSCTMLVNKENFEELNEFNRRVNGKIDFNFAYFYVIGSARKNYKQLFLKEEEIRHIYNLRNIIKGESNQLPILKSPCPNDKIAVLFNGDVTPCLMLYRDNYVFGNIYNQYLSKTWFSKNFIKFRHKNVDSIKICNSCNDKYYCGGGCHATRDLFDWKTLNTKNCPFKKQLYEKC
jgi:radical SAM protein with 4Fe4S-binding SPASM domain